MNARKARALRKLVAISLDDRRYAYQGDKFGDPVNRTIYADDTRAAYQEAKEVYSVTRRHG